MSTQGRSAVRSLRQANVASASSDPCIRLDMRLFPLARITYSLVRRVSFMSEPSSVVVSPSSSSGCKTRLRPILIIGTHAADPIHGNAYDHSLLSGLPIRVFVDSQKAFGKLVDVLVSAGLNDSPFAVEDRI
jgi:hypothetical protein